MKRFSLGTISVESEGHPGVLGVNDGAREDYHRYNYISSCVDRFYNREAFSVTVLAM